MKPWVTTNCKICPQQTPGLQASSQPIENVSAEERVEERAGLKYICGPTPSNLDENVLHFRILVCAASRHVMFIAFFLFRLSDYQVLGVINPSSLACTYSIYIFYSVFYDTDDHLLIILVPVPTVNSEYIIYRYYS